MSERISVVIPALDAAMTLGRQLEALAEQVPPPTDVVVADNGSVDVTHEVVEEWAERGLPVRLVDASQQPGAAYARNVGVRAASFDRVAFCDADDTVAPGWLAGLDAGLDVFDLVGGRLEASLLNDDAVAEWRPPREVGALSVPESFLPFAPSGNMAVHRRAWDDLGGMRIEYPIAHDVEFSWRMQLAGGRVGYAPDAVVQYRYRSTASGAFRQGLGFGRASAQLYSDFESSGLQGRSLGQTVRDWIWLIARAPTVLRQPTRGVWARRSGQAVGRLVGSVRFRVRYL